MKECRYCGAQVKRKDSEFCSDECEQKSRTQFGKLEMEARIEGEKQAREQERRSARYKALQNRKKELR